MKTRIALAVTAGLLSHSLAATQAPKTPQQIIAKDGNLAPYFQHFESVSISNSRPNAYPRIQLGPNESRRYIVELQSPSLLKFQAQQFSASKLGLTSHDFRQSSQFIEMTMDYVARLEAEQSLAWNQLHNAAPKLALLNTFSRVNNALVVKGTPDMLEDLERLPQVKRVVEESYYFKSLDTSVPLVRAPEVWTMLDPNENALLGTGMTVAIIDTGIDYTHPALGGCFGPGCKVEAGYDFHYGDADPMDVDGHGTHVAGIVAANSDTLRGVAPEATLHAYKALSDGGFGSNVDIIAAIERAVDPDQDPTTNDSVDVINMSLGGPGGENGPMSQAVDAAVEAGVIVVVAAGNGGSYDDIANTSPASARKAITVASSTKDDQLSFFSSKGSMTPSGNLKPEITAPGSDIVSSLPNNETGSLSGTSMAAPHVAGAAALLLQAYPDLPIDAIKGKLMAGTVDIGEDPFAQGTGRMDIVAALQSETIAPSGLFNFGRMENGALEWSADASLVLQNLADEAVTLTLELPVNFPEGISVTSDQMTVEIEPQSEATLTLSMLVEDVDALESPSNGAMVFFDKLTLSDESHSISLPAVVEKSNEVIVSHDSNDFAYVFLSNSNEQVYRTVGVGPNETKTIKVPGIPMTATVDFGFVFANDDLKSEAGLPSTVSAIGFEMRRINVTNDMSLEFSTSSLDQFIGYDTLVDMQGNEVIADSMGAGASLGVEHSNSSYGYWMFGYRHPVLATNTLPNDSTSYYVFGGVLEDLERPEQLDNVVISLLDKTNDSDSSLVTFDLADATQFTASFDPALAPENHVVSRTLYDEQGSGLGLLLETDATEFTFYKMNQGFLDGRVELSMNQYGEFFSLYSTDLIATTDDGSIAKIVRNTRDTLEFDTSHVSMDISSTFWTADVNASSGDVSFTAKTSSFDRAYIQDLVLNNFDAVAQPELSWSCDGEVTDPEAVRAATFSQHTVPELNCSDVQMILEFDSALHGSPYRSRMTHRLLDTQDFYIPAPHYIGLMKNGQRVFDQAVNKIDPKLVLHIDSYLADSAIIELQLGDQDWQTLPFVVSSDDGNFSIVESSLPMFRGEELANVRITYGFDVYTTEHLLNGFMLIGADAYGSNDVDDDGIENDLDTDHDNDGTENDVDAFPYDPTEDTDTDGDGIGNNADDDDDNDGVTDAEDAFPLDPTESVDSDGDGIGNNADEDDDNDGVNDSDDAFPLDPAESVDTDSDGIGNNADDDDDNDGVVDAEDAFPLDASESVDTDGDGIGNNADNDDDNDGVVDANDAFPLDPSRSAVPQPVAPNNGSGGGGTSSPLAIGSLLLAVLMTRRRRGANR